ncbi:uncharacterized protein jumu [Anabrus simplex]|uniref:uncharacterized protein jumu n=1 Tax=Anabrus simplex TaxID=316456 RepID=UPI0034DD9A18
MDMYLSAQDTFSLQEMLDCDYKTDFDSVLAGTDLGLSLSGELPPLELDDALGSASGDMSTWFSNGLHSANSNSSNSNFNLDFVGGDAAALMVNPSSVMPVTLVSVANSTPLIKQEPEEVVTYTTAAVQCSSSNSVSYVRTLSATSSNTSTSSPTTIRQRQQAATATLRIATATSTSHSVISNCGSSSILTNSNKTVPVMNSAKQQQHQTKSLTHIQVHNNRTLHQHSNKKQISNKHFSVAASVSEGDYEEKPYPKPAYSYSCLIAMALKNSKTGSLPVSEIYNFMCEHFPYFKTAPNGWKNSVRHNLSLNKCFEKIEKPTVSGSSQQQRKGCLWAMNPAKIAKMDEEVQKWSKKDPMAIKKAMVCPENLEMLERGEMKRESSDLSSFSNGQASGSLSGAEDSDADDIIDVSSNPCTPTTSHHKLVMPEFIDINDVVVDKSFDESSLTEFDIEVAEAIYDDLEDEKLNLGITLQTSAAAAGHVLQSDFEPASKRSRLNTSTIQGNYVYKPVVSAGSTTSSSARRKAPLLLRASSGASSLIKLDDP